jgi:hypothetical protein
VACPEECQEVCPEECPEKCQEELVSPQEEILPIKAHKLTKLIDSYEKYFNIFSQF